MVAFWNPLTVRPCIAVPLNAVLSSYIFQTVDSTLKTVTTFFVENLMSCKMSHIHFSPKCYRKWDIGKKTKVKPIRAQRIKKKTEAFFAI